MGFVKVVKNRAYFKRYQVPFRRRRECKTDYQQRTKLIAQDKNKYNTPKYRFVVRITNRDVVCQVFSSDLTHDECIASAYSHELKRYGLKVGLKNYAAAYCTGLLLARRVLKKYEMEDGDQVEEADGEFFLADEDSGAFKAYMDLGLARATTGANIFGALKGAVDGGLHIPHNTRRFPGASVSGSGEDKRHEYDAGIHRSRIFGGHIADYMRELEEEDVEKYQSQFADYLKAGLTADDLEDLYTKVHAAIREDPSIVRASNERGNSKVRKTARKADYATKYYNKRKISVKQRRNRVHQLMAGAKMEE